MALFEGKTPSERNKMIVAIVLPLLALIFIVRMLFGSGPSRPSTSNSNQRRPTPARTQTVATDATTTAEGAEDENIFGAMRPVVFERPGGAGGSDGGRNIFAFFERPSGPARPSSTEEEIPPTPTPTPPPPQMLASLSPPNVFAKTGEFALHVTGDKFTPESRIYIDGQMQQTQYRGAQQLTAKVPPSVIAHPGARQVMVRTPDGQLYSNTATLNVMSPPSPTYTYVGLLSRQRFDTAVLKDQKGDLYSVRKGDVVEGRFRVTDISERRVEVVDKDLNVKHTMPFIESRASGASVGHAPGVIQPPPPPPPAEDGNTGDEEP